MRCIDADTLKKSVLDLHDCYNGFSDTYDKACIIGVIDEEPTIEPEHKTGEWIWDENGMDWNLGAWKCSECKTKAETWWATQNKVHPLRCSGGNFCGVCGADMRVEQNAV